MQFGLNADGHPEAITHTPQRYGVDDPSLDPGAPIPRTYIHGTGTQRFLYASFCGKCDRNNPVFRDGRPRLIHIFTWDGEFVTELELDRHVYAIAVDGDSILYAGVFDPYPMIGEWRLPDWLRESRIRDVSRSGEVTSRNRGGGSPHVEPW